MICDPNLSNLDEFSRIISLEAKISALKGRQSRHPNFPFCPRGQPLLRG